MNSDRFQKLMGIFAEVCDLPEAQREMRLAEICSGDDRLRREVQAMLVHDAQSVAENDPLGVGRGADILAKQLAHDESSVGAPPIPETIGNYRILRRIGEGGMGTVYEAEQEQPRRRVALKVIRPGYASRQMMRRFEYEAQVLGRLQHPGIAQIFEAGTAETPLGVQPFFAMEYIAGRPLTEFATLHNLSARERLALMTQIAHAVQHAHQRGIIHRDLKPGNILINDAGQPKILDFGVARATDADLQITTMQTDVGQLLGTIPYMSPEQIVGNSSELDTRSDVYALGVILYELLSGRLPHEVRHKTVAEAARVIGEEEPIPLSSINRVFRGDIATIVAKALEKDKARRYQSAQELAADIERYLRDQPIVARPASTWYQVTKFTRRHRALVGGAGVAVALLVLGVIGTSIGFFRARAAEQLAREHLRETQSAQFQAEASRAQAEREQAKAERINEFLHDMLASVDPAKARGADVTLRDVLDGAARRVETEFKDQPEIAAALHNTIGHTYRGVAQYDQADHHLREALRLRRALFTGDHIALAESMYAVGWLLVERGEYKDARNWIVSALDMRRRLLGDRHHEVARALVGLGTADFIVGDFDAAQRVWEEAIGILREIHGGPNQEIAACLNDLARVAQTRGDYAAAEAMYLEAEQSYRETVGAVHVSVATTLNHRAYLHYIREDYAGAEALIREALAINRKLTGEEHPEVASSLSNLGVMLREQKKYEEARETLAQALDMRRRLFGDNHRDVGISLSEMGRMHMTVGEFDAAEAMFREARDIIAAAQGPEHHNVASVTVNIARAVEQKGDIDQAESLYREALTLRRKVLGNNHANVAAVLFELGGLLQRRGDTAAARELYREALNIQRAAFPAGHAKTAETLLALGRLLSTPESAVEGEALLRECLDSRSKLFGEADARTACARCALGACLMVQDRHAEAEPLLVAAHAQLHARAQDSDDAHAAAALLIQLYETTARPEDAEEMRKSSIR